jgi:hypothetical protein
MSSTDESVVPFMGPFPSEMGMLDYRDQAMMVLTPFFNLCCACLWPERGFDKLIWELLT